MKKYKYVQTETELYCFILLGTLGFSSSFFPFPYRNVSLRKRALSDFGRPERRRGSKMKMHKTRPDVLYSGSSALRNWV